MPLVDGVLVPTKFEMPQSIKEQKIGGHKEPSRPDRPSSHSQLKDGSRPSTPIPVKDGFRPSSLSQLKDGLRPSTPIPTQLKDGLRPSTQLKNGLRPFNKDGLRPSTLAQTAGRPVLYIELLQTDGRPSNLTGGRPPKQNDGRPSNLIGGRPPNRSIGRERLMLSYDTSLPNSWANPATIPIITGFKLFLREFNACLSNSWGNPVAMEVICDMSFLKLYQLIVDGDVEVNPGPTHNAGTPKG